MQIPNEPSSKFEKAIKGDPFTNLIIDYALDYNVEDDDENQDYWKRWKTVVFKTGDDSYVLFHDYGETPDYYNVMAEVSVVDRKVVRIERTAFWRSNNKNKKETILEMSDKPCVYMMPFKYMMNRYYGVSDFSIECSGSGCWMQKENVFEWLNSFCDSKLS